MSDKEDIQKPNSDKIFALADEKYREGLKQDKNYRWGQAFWNTADNVFQKWYPELLDTFRELKNTEFDCFFDNEKVLPLLGKIRELLKD